MIVELSSSDRDPLRKTWNIHCLTLDQRSTLALVDVLLCGTPRVPLDLPPSLLCPVRGQALVLISVSRWVNKSRQGQSRVQGHAECL